MCSYFVVNYPGALTQASVAKYKLLQADTKIECSIEFE
jgi:hypothetical protein